MTESLDGEWAEDGINVRSLMPSFIDTPLLDHNPNARSNEGIRQRVTDSGLEITPVDDVAAACSKLGVIRALHADQDADERKGVLVACARSTWRAGSDDDDAGDGDEDIDGEREPSDAVRCVCMVTTDACLPSAASGEASLGFPLLVNYDVPRTKEAYARRARVALGGGKGGAGRGGIGRAPGVVVTLVVADDETELLREVCGDSRVETMPVSALEEVAMNWFAYINNSGIR